MKNFFLKLFGLWRHIGVWTLCIVMALGLCIWFVGPLLAVADYRVWESPTARLLTISWGKERPVATGADESAWAQNRRSVTVVVR